MKIVLGKTSYILYLITNFTTMSFSSIIRQ